VETLISTYVAAATVVGLYVAWIALGTRSLSHHLKQLKPSFDSARLTSSRGHVLEDVA
jgi:hypothetical protein